MNHGVHYHSCGFLGYTHVQNGMPVFVSLECKTFHEILLFMFIVSHVIFVFILCESCHISDLCNKLNTYFVLGMGIGHAQHNMRYYRKHKILFLDTCFLYLYFPPEWVGK